MIDPSHPSAQVEDLVRSAGRPLVESVRLVDEYRGDQVPDDMRGLTYAITYRDPGQDPDRKRRSSAATAAW